jgi:hypothetical protein
MNQTDASSVFVNCPFDDDFRNCHLAIILTIVACGLTPRSALETGSTSVPRIKRISAALRQSRFSIHDLTRIHADPVTNVARFNMPFELGMAFQYAEHAGELGTSHDWMGLVLKGHRHHDYLSDLSGFDLMEYDGSPESVVPPVLSWLLTRPDAPVTWLDLDPAHVLSAYSHYLERIADSDRFWGPHRPFVHLVDIAREVCVDNGLFPKD